MSVFTSPASSAEGHAKAYLAAVLDLLGDEDPMVALRHTPAALQQILSELLPEQLVQPEAPVKRSVNEVLQHLADSELVWGYRLRMVLAQDHPKLIGYDQDMWADRFRYRDADAHDAVMLFGALRRANLRLLEQASARTFSGSGFTLSAVKKALNT